jgi:predicted DNA-binding transcriptional regulator YafY
VASEVEMRPWVLGWGAQVEVLEPASLREHAAESMRDGARMYGEAGAAG